jgi:catechol 2,3-dioxygenase-like lactoylglutathione lyase family enzyme
VTVSLNHTIVAAHDRQVSAEFLADILGLEVGAATGRFLPVTTANGVILDFAAAGDSPIASQHYAFLVSDDEFDAVFERIKAGGIAYFAHPGRTDPGEINHRDGGRGFYFPDPAGHSIEVFTRPYGSGEG